MFKLFIYLFNKIFIEANPIRKYLSNLSGRPLHRIKYNKIILKNEITKNIMCTTYFHCLHKI